VRHNGREVMSESVTVDDMPKTVHIDVGTLNLL